ncbi:bifunctional phosphoribosylaminoimidazolecarboxamide formyltransferase/IMP cyclohydrolase [candidate division KSB1 bacterium]|nr:bifunctional phosphoribosylaminoimidazolecarboxamide formyltransferase/IMP cyclohydrolase [candidate division KSB1 bacterium]
MIRIRRALLSVSDKSGLIELGQELLRHGVELIASGGTAAALEKAGLAVTPVEKWTGSPEAMEGRIKTLHPRIHGGLLARRDHPGDLADMGRLGLDFIDLVVINFYPFEQTLAAGKPEHEIIEAIDVGGPSMMRAAVKNAQHVVAVCDPSQYGELSALLAEWHGEVPEEFSKRCAASAFARMVAYDSAIAAWLNGGELEPLPLRRVRGLRYGENPHQQAWLYARAGEPAAGLVAADQLGGKELSYNNFLDADGALKLLREFDEPAAVIVKHVTPCGVGVGGNLSEAVTLALQTDRTSAFGGIVAFNRELDAEAAEVLAEIFLEIILAPAFSDAARAVLSKKKALRLLEFDWDELKRPFASRELRAIWGGYLRQTPDDELPELDNHKVVTRRAPTPTELAAMRLGWKVCKHVRSNAIVFADERHTLGIGAGQMSRVDSAELAVKKARMAPLELKGSACASDAFFPFRDGLEIAAKAGATAIIQPGGSVRDAEVIAAADEQNLAMVFTGRRHFRH